MPNSNKSNFKNLIFAPPQNLLEEKLLQNSAIIPTNSKQSSKYTNTDTEMYFNQNNDDNNNADDLKNNNDDVIINMPPDNFPAYPLQELHKLFNKEKLLAISLDQLSQQHQQIETTIIKLYQEHDHKITNELKKYDISALEKIAFISATIGVIVFANELWESFLEFKNDDYQTNINLLGLIKFFVAWEAAVLYFHKVHNMVHKYSANNKIHIKALIAKVNDLFKLLTQRQNSHNPLERAAIEKKIAKCIEKILGKLNNLKLLVGADEDIKILSDQIEAINNAINTQIAPLSPRQSLEPLSNLDQQDLQSNSRQQSLSLTEASVPPQINNNNKGGDNKASQSLRSIGYDEVNSSKPSNNLIVSTISQPLNRTCLTQGNNHNRFFSRQHSDQDNFNQRKNSDNLGNNNDLNLTQDPTNNAKKLV